MPDLWFWVFNKAFDSDTVVGTYASSRRPERFGVFGWECSEQPSQGSPRSSTAVNTKKYKCIRSKRATPLDLLFTPFHVLTPYHLFVLVYVSIWVAHIVCSSMAASCISSLLVIAVWVAHTSMLVWGPFSFSSFQALLCCLSSFGSSMQRLEIIWLMVDFVGHQAFQILSNPKLSLFFHPLVSTSSVI